MSVLQSIGSFILHRLRSRKWDSFHSPYLFNLFNYACDEKIIFPEFREIEQERLGFLKSKEKIKRTDLGAGSVLNHNQEDMHISTIARSSLSHPFQCRFMSRLVRYTCPQTIVEFGTSFGISSAYLSVGSPQSKITTIEGDPASAIVANHLFSKLGLLNVKLINLPFEDFINDTLKGYKTIDFLFFDGNHRSNALVSYYHKLKPLLHSSSIVIIDDIYWSKDMEEGWIKLTNLPEITQSVDCYHFGLLFFNPDFIEKQNHKINLPLKSLVKD